MKLIAKKKKPNDHFVVFEELLSLCFILCHSLYTFLNGFITLKILNEIFYSTLP